jgi:hypothetical protein
MPAENLFPSCICRLYPATVNVKKNYIWPVLRVLHRDQQFSIVADENLTSFPLAMCNVHSLFSGFLIKFLADFLRSSSEVAGSKSQAIY